MPGPSPLFHADIHLDPGARLALPVEHEERAVLVVEGDVEVEGEPIPPRHLAVVGPGDAVVAAASRARIMTFGGAPVGPRHIWWNFVSSRPDRIEQAKADWTARRFAPSPASTTASSSPPADVALLTLAPAHAGPDSGGPGRRRIRSSGTRWR